MFKFGTIPFVLALFCVSGCLTYTTIMYSPTDEGNSVSREKKHISYGFRRTSRVSASTSFDKTNCSDTLTGAWAEPQTEEIALKQFRSAFVKDTLEITPLITKDDDSTIRMEIMQQNSWNGLGLFGAVLSGFTLTLIPCWGDDVYTLYVEATDNRGHNKTYQLTSSVTTITWAPFILALPFAESPNKRVNEITCQYWAELVKRMRQDGFFTATVDESYEKRVRNKDLLDQLYKRGLMTEDEYCKAIGNLD